MKFQRRSTLVQGVLNNRKKRLQKIKKGVTHTTSTTVSTVPHLGLLDHPSNSPDLAPLNFNLFGPLYDFIWKSTAIWQWRHVFSYSCEVIPKNSTMRGYMCFHIDGTSTCVWKESTSRSVYNLKQVWSLTLMLILKCGSNLTDPPIIIITALPFDLGKFF